MRPRTLASVMLLLAACSGGDDGTGAATTLTPPTTQAERDIQLPFGPDGPLAGIVMVGAHDPSAVIEPRLMFSTNDTEATALVGLGSDTPDGGQLTVEWFRSTGIDEREPLFRHTIEVGPNGIAASQGVSSSGLAPGIYEVVATLGEHDASVPFQVRQPQTSNLRAPQQAGDEDWNTPSAGDSGWYEPNNEPPFDPQAGPCKPQSVSQGFSPLTEATMSVSWWGTCKSAALSMSAGGEFRTVFDGDVSTDENGFYGSGEDICALPGGSDMPGTVVTARAVLDGTAIEATDTLEDHGPAFVTMMESSPASGAQVKPGDVIRLHAVGLLFPAAQGVDRVTLTAAGSELTSATNVSGASQPVPCDLGRLFAEVSHEYTVPDPAPTIVEVCANGITFDGYKSTDCVRFSTRGEAWTGEMELTYEGNIAAEANVVCGGAATFTFDVSVDASGNVTGTGDIDGPPYVCLIDDVRAQGLSPAGPFTLIGTKSDTAFELQGIPGPGVGCCPAWPGDALLKFTAPLTSPTRAKIDLSGPNDLGQPWVGDLSVTGEMRCTTCGS